MENSVVFWDRKYGRNFLKITALMTMLCDHIGCVLLSGEKYEQLYNIMRIIGRISFPLFCFMLVEGFCHTHDKKKYIQRLAVFAVISEIPFDIAFKGKIVNIYSQNVMWTLLIGFIAMYFIEKYYHIAAARIFIIITGMIVALLLNTDYNLWGVLIISILYLYRNNNAQKLILMSIALFAQGQMEAFAVLSIPFILKYDENKVEKPMPKYISYIFYPAHLLMLYMIKIILKV